MSNTGLATLDSLNSIIQSEQQKANTDLASVMSGGFMPYVALYGANSEIVKRNEFPMGNFGLTEGKTLTPLGDSVVMYFLARRPKAMQYKPTALSFYDPNAEDFKNIRTRAEEANSNCGYGVEFMVYIPKVGKFATYFLGTKTGRNECPNIVNAMSDGHGGIRPVALIQRSVLLKNAKGTWHGPTTQQVDQAVDIPVDKLDEFKSRYHSFCNPPVKESAVDDAEDSRD